ncbi:MAG: hypothetical protein LUC86_04510 [Prevotellaceae bacterium]|nr:hypothetical protein [Prevotellaceae bacterium]
MRFFRDTQESVRDLFVETGEYANLCKRFAHKLLTEKIGALICLAVVALALVLLASTVLLLLFFALAYWLGDLLGSQALGFGCLTVIALVVTLLVCALRRCLIMAPINRKVRKLLRDTEDSCTASELGQQVLRKQREIQDSLRAISRARKRRRNPAARLAEAVSKAAALYKSFKLGADLASRLRKMFGRRKGKA